MKKEILQALPKLTKAELKEVKASLDFFLQGEVVDRDDFEIKLFEAFRSALETHGVFIPSNWLDKSTYTKTWEQHLQAIRSLLVRFQGGAATPLAGQTLYATQRLLWGLLAADLKERGAAVSPGSMVNNMARLPAVFSKAFPGYLEAGHAGLIVKRLKEAGNER